VTAPEGAQESLAAALGVEVVATDATGTSCLDVPAAAWLPALAHARDVLGLDLLDWLSAVDEPEADPPAVDVVAHLVDTSSPPGRLHRLLLRTRVPVGALSLPSATPLWAGAAWHERETHEMFGVDFTGFRDPVGEPLRPLLLPDGFEGTPLRKSFVLASRAVRPWPGAKEPGESGEGNASPSRRKLLPPGVPDPATWGPRRPEPATNGTPDEPPADEQAAAEPPAEEER